MNTNMNATMNTENNIFRFKFSSDFNDKLLSFSKLHQHDDRNTYKDNWYRWILANYDMIETESRRLVELGYPGNIIDKMYKSGRYYYRTKKPTNEPKKRRKYISIDSELIEAMDKHIKNNVESNTIKPSKAYDIFTKEYEPDVMDAISRLIESELTRDEIKLKIKKTYKNRYFLYTTNTNNREI